MRVVSVRNLDSTSAVLSGFVYSYDAAGNRVNVVEGWVALSGYGGSWGPCPRLRGHAAREWVCYDRLRKQTIEWGEKCTTGSGASVSSTVAPGHRRLF